MAEVKFNQDGDLINIQTGQVIGSFRNNNEIRFSSDDSEVKSLQQTGVSLPPSPQDKSNEKSRKNFSMSSVSNVPMTKVDVLKSNSHVENGKSSFKYRQSKYQVNKDSYFIIKFGLLRQSDGRFVPIDYASSDNYKDAEKHWVKFRMWNYMEQIQWKQSVMEYNSVAKMQVLNHDKLNEIKIKKLILDWSFGQYDDSLKLLHCDNLLSDESYDVFMWMHPSIARTIVNLMNSVLENNQ